jgi:lipopolysaccharide transport system ATP-binding protein
MYVRLAFSVAAYMDTEILLVDEVLAVGDAAFQKKCLGKMGDVATKEGRTVVFVSHNMTAVRDICKEGLLLDHGQMKRKGEISEVVTEYIESVSDKKEATVIIKISDNVPVSFRSVCILDENGIGKNHFRIFEKIFVEIKYRVNNRISGVNIAIVTSWRNSTVFTSYDTDLNEQFLDWREPGEYCARFSMPSDILKPGQYSLRVVAGMVGIGIIKDLGDVLSFTIDHDEKRSATKGYSENRDGIIVCKSQWDVEKTGE